VKKQALARLKLRERTWEKPGQFKNPCTVSEKTGFGKVEITTAYMGKRKQVQKPMYGSEINISSK
jgi:hypothetical protein